jgi:hypothetical protein
MALAQPSSFFDNDQEGNFLDNPFSQRLRQSEMYSVRSSSIFNEYNQNSMRESEQSKIIVFPNVNIQEKLIELEEYNGFSLAEWGEIEVSYNKKDVALLYNLKFVCLKRQAHNDFYIYPYLTVCFELEFEGMGTSKKAAMDDLFEYLDIYFNGTREICETSEEYVNVITANINEENHWKRSFARTYKQAQKLDIINIDYQHRII